MRFSTSFEGCLVLCCCSSGWCGDSEGDKSHPEREDWTEGWQVRKPRLAHGFCRMSPEGRCHAYVQLTDEKTKSLGCLHFRHRNAPVCRRKGAEKRGTRGASKATRCKSSISSKFWFFMLICLLRSLCISVWVSYESEVFNYQ